MRDPERWDVEQQIAHAASHTKPNAKGATTSAIENGVAAGVGRRRA